MSNRIFIAVCLTVGLAACRGERQGGVTVTDSAGVRITVSADSARSFAEVEPQPVLSLGGPDAAGPTQFHRIQNVEVGPSGRLWVVDGGSAEVRIFAPDGSHWKTIGGRGEGPGEFTRIRLLGSFGGDSVAVWDDANARLTVFDSAGELARTASVASGDALAPRAFDVFGDGSVLAQVPRQLSADSLVPGRLLADTVRLVRIDLDSATAEPLVQVRGPVWVWTGRGLIPIPFTINAGFDLYDESVHIVAGPEFRVRVFEGGRLSEVYGVARDPRAVTEEDVTAYRAFVDEFIPESQRPDYLSVLDSEYRPRVLPAYSRFLLSADGNVWAQVYSADFLASATWDVYGPGREWLGQVGTPEGFAVTTVTGDKLVGVWRDDSGVEYVRVYRYRANGESR
ncbi:MAG: 6-bladed beta-propeller [Gemmatimonadales bacterium]|jgi:hypothetical protein